MKECMDDYATLAADIRATNRRASTKVLAASLIGFVEELNDKMGIPRKLKEVGLVEQDIEAIAEESMPSGSLAANRPKAQKEDVMSILQANL